MAERGLCLALEFRDNALGQHLAKLHAPLVERINLPDSALGEHAVLVKGDQLAENFRREPIGEDSVRRAVTLEDPVGDEPRRCALGFDLLGRLPECQRLSLGEDGRQKHVVMTAELVEWLAKRDEVTGDEPGPLVDQLVERMLTVSSWLAPVDGASRVGDLGSIERDVLAV